MTCSDPVAFGAATALNIAATDFSQATHDSGGLIVAAAENQFILITKPLAAESGGALTYDAYSVWSSDGATPPGTGLTWGNRFYVYGSNGGAETLLFDSQDYFEANYAGETYYATAQEAWEALDTVLPLWAGGGYSQYRITSRVDSPLGDNRGGLSLLVQLGTVAAPGLDADPVAGSEDHVITLAYFAKFEFPDGDVRLCDGGMLSYGGEDYQSQDAVFGSIHTPGEIETGFGDLAEGLTMTLAPNPEAALSDWWRGDLFDCRVRIWMGRVDADQYTVSEAKLVADLLVSTYGRRQGAGGEDVLELEMMGRAEKLFLKNEGNVLSSRFHQTMWPGEKGLDNCTDLTGYLAWGARAPQRSSSGSTSSGGGGFTFGTTVSFG